jgi:hypothetical protein
MCVFSHHQSSIIISNHQSSITNHQSPRHLRPCWPAPHSASRRTERSGWRGGRHLQVARHRSGRGLHRRRDRRRDASRRRQAPPVRAARQRGPRHPQRRAGPAQEQSVESRGALRPHQVSEFWRSTIRRPTSSTCMIESLRPHTLTASPTHNNSDQTHITKYTHTHTTTQTNPPART